MSSSNDLVKNIMNCRKFRFGSHIYLFNIFTFQLSSQSSLNKNKVEMILNEVTLLFNYSKF